MTRCGKILLARPQDAGDPNLINAAMRPRQPNAATRIIGNEILDLDRASVALTISCLIICSGFGEPE